MHFCISSYKDSVQLRKRLLQTAKNTAEDYEVVTEHGPLLKAAVIPENPTVKKLALLKEYIMKRFEIPENLISIDIEKMRLETMSEIAKELSKIYRKRWLRYLLVEEYPPETDLRQKQCRSKPYSRSPCLPGNN